MNGLDWLIIGILVLSVLMAAAQGFFFELFSFVGAIFGYLLAAWEYKTVAVWIIPYVKNEWVANSAAFLIIFMSVVILAGIVARIARWAMQEVGLRWFDRLLGAAFGLLRGALVVMVLVMALASFGPGSQKLAESSLGSYFLVLGRAAMWATPTEFRQQFRSGLKTLNDMRSGHNPQSPEVKNNPPVKSEAGQKK